MTPKQLLALRAVPVRVQAHLHERLRHRAFPRGIRSSFNDPIRR